MPTVAGEAIVPFSGDFSELQREAMATMTKLVAEMSALTKKPLVFRVEADTAPAAYSILELRTIASNPLVIPVKADVTDAAMQIAALRSAAETAGGIGGGDRGGGGGDAAAAVAAGSLMGRFGKGGLLGALGWGGGMFGGAGIGTIAGLAGFGFEHLLTTGLGLGGSLVGAGLGGGLLGLGTAGTIGVGAGSDMAVMKDAQKEVQQYGAALDKLNRAVALYGANSAQAKAAQYDLNQVTAAFTPALLAAVQATNAQKTALAQLWDQQTATAKVTANAIMQQVLGLGTVYTPLIAQAAQTNLGIINNGIKPLFAWLEGPQGIGIFKDLEAQFARNLPTAVHAFVQGIELFIKTVDTASHYTGQFLPKLDAFLTKYNSPTGFATWAGDIGKLIGMFRAWEALVIELGRDLILLFKPSAGLGTGIVHEVTDQLYRLHDWLTTHQGELSTFFTAHKDEVISLLKLIPTLISPLSQLFLPMAGALSEMVALIAEFVGWLAKVPGVGPVLVWAGAIAILASRMKLLTFAQWIGDLMKFRTAFAEFAGQFGIGAAIKATMGFGAEASTAVGGAEQLAMNFGGVGTAAAGAGGATTGLAGSLAAFAAPAAVVIGGLGGIFLWLSNVSQGLNNLSDHPGWANIKSDFVNQLQTPGTGAYNALHSDNLQAIKDLEDYAQAHGWTDIVNTAKSTYDQVLNAHIAMIQGMLQQNSTYDLQVLSDIGTLSGAQQRALNDYMMTYTLATDSQRQMAAKLAQDFTADQIQQQIAAGLVPPAIGQIALAIQQVPGALQLQSQAWSTWSILTGGDIQAVQNALNGPIGQLNTLNSLLANLPNLVNQFNSYLNSPAIQQGLNAFHQAVANDQAALNALRNTPVPKPPPTPSMFGPGPTYSNQFGYQHGGVITEPLFAIGMRSGKRGTLGEGGLPEVVMPLASTWSTDLIAALTGGAGMTSPPPWRTIAAAAPAQQSVAPRVAPIVIQQHNEFHNHGATIDELVPAMQDVAAAWVGKAMAAVKARQ